MPTILPSWAPSWLQARHTADAAIPLLEVFHPQIEVLRFARNTVDIVSRGNTYSASMFDFDIINDNDRPARSQIIFPNVDPVIGKTLKSLIGPARITIEVINAAEPEEPVYRAALLKLKNIQVDPLTVTGELVRNDDATEICGTIRVVPSKFPALFRQR